MGGYKRIFIVGQPGAGKALLAKAVAKALNWRFVDADLGLESRIGRSINTILGIKGHSTFNDCQNEILRTLCDQKHIVVTTDASVIDAKNNCQLLTNELTVFLVTGSRLAFCQIKPLPNLKSQRLGFKIKPYKNHLIGKRQDATPSRGTRWYTRFDNNSLFNEKAIYTTIRGLGLMLWIVSTLLLRDVLKKVPA